MLAWAALALALRSPEQDALHSRLSTYLHPLCGRSLAWHVLKSMASLRPAPAKIILLTTEAGERASIGELPVEPLVTEGDAWWSAARERIPAEADKVLLVDAAAPLLSTSLAQLIAGPVGRVLIGEGGAPLAVWLSRAELEARAASLGDDAPTDYPAPMAELAHGLEPVEAVSTEGILVRDRARLARAIAVVRDRTVANLTAAGVTFLLPESVLVDVDVTIGVDTVIYPGVVLEGQTTIGSETVVGPGCRIIDSWVGSGVELKGWNYISSANVRNRAVLEPYVRRGFD